MSLGTIMDNLSVVSLDDIDTELKNDEQKQFKVKRYIPHKYSFKCLCCAVGCVAVTLGIVIIVSIMSTKNSNSTIESAQLSSSFGEKLVLLTNNADFFILDPKTNDLKNFISKVSINAVTAFDIRVDGRVYWSEIDASRLITQSSNDNSTILLEDGRLKPKGLALDRVAENLYIMDENAGIFVINVRLGHCGLLVSDLTKPCDIVLDSEEGLMFILQSSKSIVRANMDGTNPTTIVTNIGITALTLDSNGKRLYWISEFVNIESSNYDGSKRQSFFTDTVTIATLTVLNERIYWLWPSHGHVTSLLSCEIGRNDTCIDYKIHDIEDVSNAKLIKSYPTARILINNPCKIKNGGCQQLCLISGKSRRSCACRIGWQLNTDRRSCREAHDFLLYPYDNVIRASSLDGSKDLIWPTPYKVESLKMKGEIDFDYDSRNDDFYFSDDFHIYTIKLRSASNQTEILNSRESSMIIEDIAYDWLSSNVYFVQRGTTNGSKDHSIILINRRLGETYRKTIMAARHRSPFGIHRCPYSLTLHPTLGQIIYACDLDGTRIIQQSTMNGTSVHRYEHPFLPMSYGHILSLDYIDDSLYWISFSVDMTFVEHTKINRKLSTSLTVEGVRRAGGIDVFQQWLFISNSSSIWRANKETGKDVIKIAPRLDDNSRKIAGMKIVSEAVQFSGKGNPCEENNGGCEQFCFAGAKVTCDCKDGQTVGSDGRCS